ncbi:MAG: chemotaxis protein CheR [Marinilabiliales bacterium]|nr:MAG: chemotaxis protein CheR [Marinilabiliales bacterium]
MDLNDNNREKIEADLLIEAVKRYYGYDFSNYSKAHIKRRMSVFLSKHRYESISEMQHYVLHNPNIFEDFLNNFSINVTEMFRDPGFYKDFRESVIPILKTYPYLKIWIAGCATGEEVYSFAIMLQEEGLLARSTIYATDFNSKALQKAGKAIYNIDTIKSYTSNYQKSGGKSSFSDYYMANYNSVIINKSLKENVVFAEHNLVTDGVFTEANLIVCRNVLIYFDRDLQDKVLALFNNSLIQGGYLALGTKETIQFSEINSKFSTISKENKIYKKTSI